NLHDWPSAPQVLVPLVVPVQEPWSPAALSGVSKQAMPGQAPTSHEQQSLVPQPANPAALMPIPVSVVTESHPWQELVQKRDGSPLTMSLNSVAPSSQRGGGQVYGFEEG